MDLFGRASKGSLVRKPVDPWVDLVTLVEEHGQAVLGSDTCPIKVVKERTIFWETAIGQGFLEVRM